MGSRSGATSRRNGIDGSWLDDSTKRHWRREWSREIDALIAQLD